MTGGQAARLAAVSAATVLSVHGPPPGFGGTVTHLQNAVADALAGPSFGDAAMSLQQYRRLSGTYDGADVTGQGVVLRWGTDAHFCIEGVRQSGAVEHLVGPYGRVESGPCPVASF